MKSFWGVPHSIAKRKNLSFKAKLIAGVLWSLKGQDSKVFPSRKFLAEAIGSSRKTVDRGIKELAVKAGLIVKRRGFGKTNCYLVPNWTDSPNLSTQEETKEGSLEKNIASTHKGTASETIIDYLNRNKNNKKESNNSAVNLVLNYFRELVGETRGFEPEIDLGKDSRLVGLRLKKYSLEELKSLIKWYLKSQVSDKLGISISACLSAHVINLWKASKSQSAILERIYPKWTELKPFKNRRE